jgi:hypothetical protein
VDLQALPNNDKEKDIVLTDIVYFTPVLSSI